MSLSLGPRGLGESWMNQLRTTFILPLASRQQWAFESVIKATHAPSAKLWKQVNVHRTRRPLLGPPRPGPCIPPPPRCPTAVRRCPDGPACTVSGCRELPSVSLAPEDHLTRLCDSVRPVSSQVQGHPPHSSEGSRCPDL